MKVVTAAALLHPASNLISRRGFLFVFDVYTSTFAYTQSTNYYCELFGEKFRIFIVVREIIPVIRKVLCKTELVRRVLILSFLQKCFLIIFDCFEVSPVL